MSGRSARRADRPSFVGMIVLAAFAALGIVAASGAAAQSGPSGPTGPDTTTTTTPTVPPVASWNITVTVDASTWPIVVSGRAVYTDAGLVPHPANNVYLTLLGSDGKALAGNSACNLGQINVANQPANTSSDDGTLGPDGAFSFKQPLACFGTGYTAHIDANVENALPPIPAGTQTSGPFDFKKPAGGTPTPPNKTPVHPKTNPAPPPKASTPSQTLPKISGSRTQQVGPGSDSSDTFDSALNYPEPGDSSAVSPDASALNNATGAKTTRSLNTRLIAASAAGVALVSVMVSQILILNRRGRDLESSLPLIDEGAEAV